MCHVIVCTCTCAQPACMHIPYPLTVLSIHHQWRSRQDAGRYEVPGERVCGHLICRRTHANLGRGQLPESQPRWVYPLRWADQPERSSLQRMVLAESHPKPSVLCLPSWTAGGEWKNLHKYLIVASGKYMHGITVPQCKGVEMNVQIVGAQYKWMLGCGIAWSSYMACLPVVWCAEMWVYRCDHPLDVHTHVHRGAALLSHCTHKICSRIDLHRCRAVNLMTLWSYAM